MENWKRELALCRAELEQTRAYLQGILQNTSEIIFATDVEGLLVSFSNGGQKVLGYTLAEILGTPAIELAWEKRRMQGGMEEAIAKGHAILMEVDLKAKDGHAVLCNIALVSLKNREGKTVGTVGICQEIGAWKELQAKVRSVERLAEMGRLAAGIAHEINNPLAVIQEIAGWGKAVLSDREDIPTELKADLERAFLDILEQTKRGRTVTHQLLGLVRESAFEPKEVDLAQVVERTVAFLSSEIRRSSVEVEILKEKGPLTAFTDPRLLEQILVNLLQNGLDAIEEKGTKEGKIRLGVSREGSRWKIVVEDNGIGIAREHQPHIFELLYTTKGPGKGTGLGLPICQRLAQQLGGEIGFQSQWGIGSIFWVAFPDAREDPERD